MTIEIDNTRKTVQVSGEHTLGEVFEFLEKSLGVSWKEYKLMVKETPYYICCTPPIIIESPNPYKHYITC